MTDTQDKQPLWSDKRIDMTWLEADMKNTTHRIPFDMRDEYEAELTRLGEELAEAIDFITGESRTAFAALEAKNAALRARLAESEVPA